MADLGDHETIRAEGLPAQRPEGRHLRRPGPTGGLSEQPTSPVATLDRDEAQRTRVRIRRILNLGLIMLPGTIATDWLVCTYLEPTALRPILLLRLIGGLAVAGMSLHLRTYKTARRLMLYEQLMTPTLAVLGGGLPSVLAGGVGSVYGLTSAVLLVARAAMWNDSWRQAWPSVVATALAQLATVLVAAAWSPRLAAQLHDVSQVGHLAFYTLINVYVGVLALAGSHAAHILRRQLFEAREVGRYRLDRFLGKGGMGEVWAAYYPPLRREVALKILRLGERDPDGQITRFEREVAATAALSHPHTIRIFDFGVTDDGLWYYAMELLEGENLKALVRREGPLEPGRAARLVGDVASAIAEAHARGIVHRDLKPENLFLTRPGGRDFIKVLDFGLARQDSDTIGLTRQGILGTPAYFSQEVALGAKAETPADVYALGATLYFALAGRPPFEHPEIAALLTAIATATPPSVSTARGAPIPPVLEQLVARAMARDVAARPSAAELALALEQAALAIGRPAP